MPLDKDEELISDGVLLRLHIYSKTGCPHSTNAVDLARSIYEAPDNKSYKIRCENPPKITKLSREESMTFHKKFKETFTERFTHNCDQKKLKRHFTHPTIIAEVELGEYRFIGGYEELYVLATGEKQKTRPRVTGRFMRHK